MGILWTILIGFIAGVLAKLITPGDNEPSGFILTTILGIVGAFVASFLGQALGWYNAWRGCWSHWCDRWGDHRASCLGRHCWQAEEHPPLKRLPGSMRRWPPPSPQNSVSSRKQTCGTVCLGPLMTLSGHSLRFFRYER
jgi:uncharacterized membrane protein YeaQ/YmgE (transglycosylase-associated protein family)